MLFDTIIKNVEVFDGTGEQSFCADVANVMEKSLKLVKSIMKIVANWLREPAYIAPADVHTHDDTNVICYPDCLPKISQGVTTVIVGDQEQCITNRFGW